MCTMLPVSTQENMFYMLKVLIIELKITLILMVIGIYFSQRIIPILINNFLEKEKTSFV